MVVLVTCKNEENPIKNEGARVNQFLRCSSLWSARQNNPESYSQRQKVIARTLGLHYNHYVSPSVRPIPVSEYVHNS